MGNFLIRWMKSALGYPTQEQIEEKQRRVSLILNHLFKNYFSFRYAEPSKVIINWICDLGAAEKGAQEESSGI